MPEARHAMAADPHDAAAWHTPARHRDNGRPGPRGVRVIDMRPGGRHARDRGQAWLRSAMAALAVLAAAAAAVSWDAQYVLVRALQRKAAFISQVMHGRLVAREVGDIGDTALSFSEVKALATGNPLLMDKAEADTNL